MTRLVYAAASSLTEVSHLPPGYLAGAFALRYPDLVSDLILLSPAGVPSPSSESNASSRRPSSDASSRRGSGPDGAKDRPSSADMSEIRNALEMETGLPSAESGGESGRGSDSDSTGGLPMPTPAEGLGPLSEQATLPDLTLEDRMHLVESAGLPTGPPQRFKGPTGKSGPLMSAVYSHMWEVRGPLLLYPLSACACNSR